MNKAILETGVQDYIHAHRDDDVQRIALSKSPFVDVGPSELARQVDGMQRSRKKLPSWHRTRGVVYPAKLSIEQSSSEQAAAFKACLLPGGSLADLTGGFGVDSTAFAGNHQNVTHFETDGELSAIAAHNAVVMGCANIRFIAADGIEYLRSSSERYDTIYLDPARRVNSSKVFRLADCRPDIVANQDMLFSHTGRILLKTSPLLDIRSGLAELKHVSDIYVVSIANECKELLWMMKKGYNGPVSMHAIMLSDNLTYSFSLGDETNYETVTYSKPLAYLYEPDAAVMKAGAFKLLTRDYPVLKLEKSSHLYTSDKPVDRFPGRVLEIEQVLAYGDFARMKEKVSANVIARNFHLKADELVKKHRISPASRRFIVFTQVQGMGLTVLITRQVG